MYQSNGAASTQKHGQSRFVKYDKSITKISNGFPLESTSFFLTGEEGITDSTGNNIIVDYDLLTTSDVQVRFGEQSLLFDSKRIDVGSYTLGTSDFSIDTWIYRTNGGTNHTIFEYGTFSAGILVRCNGTANVDFWINNTNYTFSTNTDLVTDQWFHVVLQKTAGDYYLFINGALESNITGRSDNFPSYILGVGYSRHASNQRFIGYMDNFRVVMGQSLFPNVAFNHEDESVLQYKTIKQVQYGLQSSIPIEFVGVRPSYNSGVVDLPGWQLSYQRPKARLTYTYSLGYDILKLNPVGWWDMANIDSLTINGGDVEQWNDLSTSGNNAYNPTASNYPEYGTFQLNGIDVLTADDNSNIGLRTDLTINNPHTIILVCKNRAGSGRVVKSGTINALMSPSRGIFAFYLNNTVVSSGPVPSTDWSIVTFGNGVTASEVWWKSINYAGAGIFNSNWGTFSIANGWPNISENPQADIAEIIVFDRRISTIEREEIEGYLAHKWDLLDQLGVGHPYENNPPTN